MMPIKRVNVEHIISGPVSRPYFHRDLTYYNAPDGIDIKTGIYKKPSDHFLTLLSNEHAVKSGVNNAQTWNIDTAGLNSAQTIDICINTFQNMYGARYTGLNIQSLTGTTWTEDTAFPATYCNVISTDRRSRLFTGTNIKSNLFT